MKKLEMLVVVVLVLFMVTGSPAALVARYEFEGDLIDTSGNGLDGIGQGAQPDMERERPGEVLWDPGWGYVDCGTSPLFDIIHQITVTAWVKVTAFDKPWQAIVTKGDSAWRLHRSNISNSLAFHCSGLSAGWGADGSVNVNDGKWHHVAGVYDGGTIYLYVDGSLDNSVATSGTIGLNAEPVYIGGNSEKPSEGFRAWYGWIDDVSIYDHPLSPTEIAKLAGKTNGAPDGLTGTGTTNYIAKFTGVDSIGDSGLYEAGSLMDPKIGFGTTTPEEKFTVVGGTIKCTSNYINGRGLYGIANSDDAMGVCGEATATGFQQNYGGYFEAAGDLGIGVFGKATSTSLGPDPDSPGPLPTYYGGYFSAPGLRGIGLYAKGGAWAAKFDGRLDVIGSIYQRGNQLHADYVFEPGYKLESIDEHSRFMWKNRHLKALPKAETDINGQEVVEIGAHYKGIVEELEKAHIYIEQLNNRTRVLEQKLAKFEAGLNTEQ